MAIEKTTKYKIFYKYKSTDSGLTWTKVEPEETEYVAWNTNSIDCGYIPPIKQDTTGGTTGDTGTTSERCETVVTYKDGTTSAYTINGEITSSSIPKISAATKVDIGTCATGIGYEAFSEGENIESITMGNSIKSIASSGFSSCWLLTSLTIGSGVTSIGDYVFKNCNNLDLIHYQGTKEQWYAIKKGEKWNTNWSSYKWAKTIQCTNGNITYN